LAALNERRDPGVRVPGRAEGHRSSPGATSAVSQVPTHEPRSPQAREIKPNRGIALRRSGDCHMERTHAWAE
jgi:hypothetical protein